MVDRLKLPALHDAASSGSDRAQRRYLWLIRGEYCLLLLSSILTMDFYGVPVYYAGGALVFFVSLAVMLFRSLDKPEKQWYNCRAVAESIKTISWRYAMRAAPFDVDEGENRLFRNALSNILADSNFIGVALTGNPSTGDQITGEMVSIRTLPINERLEHYKKDRIDDQRLWYARKASRNKRSAGIWIGVGVVVYLFSATSVLTHIVEPTWTLLPTDPLIVIASSVLGWVQIKKFNELAAAYTLTAHEIGILQNRIGEITSESDLSEFINDSELAFSREHTQWVARASN